MEITKEELQKMIQETINEKEKENLKKEGSKMEKNIITSGEVRKPTKAEAKLAHYILSVAAGKGNRDLSIKWAEKRGYDEVVKALNTGVPEEGGFLVPEEWATDIIELLKPISVMRRMGARSYPMGAATTHIPSITGGAMAEYIGEGQDITASQGSFGQKVLTWKKLAALVPISNDLIRFSPYNVETIVSNDMISSIALREDRAFLRDDGTGETIKGVRYLAPTTATTGDPEQDLATLEYMLKNAHMPMQTAGYIISPRTEKYLKYMKDAYDRYVFKEEMRNGRLNGYPYAVSYDIPENLGVGENETEIYMIVFSEAIIGESYNLNLETSSEASYWDGTKYISAFSTDQTIIRAIMENDFILRHDEAAAVLTGVVWDV